MKKMLYVPVLACSLLLLAGCVSANPSGYAVPDQQSADTSPVEAGACEYPLDGQPAKPADPPATTDVKTQGKALATLHLTAGDVEITLDPATAPCTVNSFESLAEQGYFDGTACHRLTTDGIYILQCGDPSATGMGGPGYSFADETNDSMSYPAGTVAMANAGPDTNGSQFFLVWADSQLPPAYTVFGTMDTAGLEVVAGIAAEGVSLEDQTSPNAEALIESVKLG